MFSHNPLHGSGQAGFPHPALALGEDARAAERIGMTDGRQRQPASDEAPHAVPEYATVLAAPRQRAMPEPSHLESKKSQRRVVHGHSVIPDVSTHHRLQPLALFGDGFVHTTLKFGFYLIQLRLQPFAYRLPQHRKPSIAQRHMKNPRLFAVVLTLLGFATLAGCFGTSTKSPEVSANIRNSLDQAGFKDVSVSQDRDKGLVTLGGQVGSEYDKSQAEAIAKSFAGNQVVADQIAVVPLGVEKEAKAMNSDLDQGIENNLDAALIQNKMHDHVKYDVKSGVVTLTGEVNSQTKRDNAEKVAMSPNVKQVVNDLQVKNQKASSSQ